jgi:hypothetical protein
MAGYAHPGRHGQPQFKEKIMFSKSAQRYDALYSFKDHHAETEQIPALDLGRVRALKPVCGRPWQQKESGDCNTRPDLLK